jgi:serine/threonine protein kinase
VSEAVLKAGDLLDGKWRIEGLLGEGGMGAVYAARHIRNGREAALKLLHPAVAADKAARERFLQEGYAANQVDHPGAVQVLDDGVCADGVFLVMERLRGASIESVAEARGDRLDLVSTLAILDAALDVVDAAHRKGMVHRDLKPENLFLTEQGLLKVLDFGLARVRQSESGVKLTATGVPMGTPAFMPPEQSLAHWDEVDASSDVFALGATAYTLLSGQLVHPARSAPEMLVMASTRQARSIRFAVPQVPPAIAEVVDRALAFDRHHASAMPARCAPLFELPSPPPVWLCPRSPRWVCSTPAASLAMPDTAEVPSDAVRTVPAITPSMQQPTPTCSAVAARPIPRRSGLGSASQIAVQGAAGRAAPPRISELGPTETVAPITSDRGRSRAGSVAAAIGVTAPRDRWLRWPSTGSRRPGALAGSAVSPVNLDTQASDRSRPPHADLAPPPTVMPSRHGRSSVSASATPEVPPPPPAAARARPHQPKPPRDRRRSLRQTDRAACFDASSVRGRRPARRLSAAPNREQGALRRLGCSVRARELNLRVGADEFLSVSS